MSWGHPAAWGFPVGGATLRGDGGENFCPLSKKVVCTGSFEAAKWLAYQWGWGTMLGMVERNGNRRERNPPKWPGSGAGGARGSVQKLEPCPDPQRVLWSAVTIRGAWVPTCCRVLLRLPVVGFALLPALLHDLLLLPLLTAFSDCQEIPGIPEHLLQRSGSKIPFFSL